MIMGIKEKVAWLIIPGDIRYFRCSLQVDNTYNQFNGPDWSSHSVLCIDQMSVQNSCKMGKHERKMESPKTSLEELLVFNAQPTGTVISRRSLEETTSVKLCVLQKMFDIETWDKTVLTNHMISKEQQIR